jgi:hypothetical protein
MALIDDVQAICRRLGRQKWKELFLKHGLDITADDLEPELAKELPIKRSVPGFEDFAANGKRGIEPGKPGLSLLFHGLASPLVREVDGRTLGAFPTLRELDTIENYVFAARKVSLAKLRQTVGNAKLSVVLFATEYRSAKDTPHGAHADQAFSRTGVARVGTEQARYDGLVRGFLPFADGMPHAIRVLPARYVAYLALQRAGNDAAAVPMDFVDGDAGRKFWIPIHKLFSGDECLTDGPLEVEFSCRHVNEKLARVRRFVDVTVDPAALAQPPYRFEEGIAELSDGRDLPPGLVVPVAHESLVAEARLPNGDFATYRVPRGKTFGDTSSVEIPANGARHAPEYLHARTRVAGNQLEDLNELADVAAAVNRGGYDALHYLDFTGDGWVTCQVAGLAAAAEILPAYSIVAAPDFFPSCGQRELIKWGDGLGNLRREVWAQTPEFLSEGRLPANVQLADSPFDIAEDTVTAVVPLAGSIKRAEVVFPTPDTHRHSALPDDAAGLFAPGWDTSIDTDARGRMHLAAYGLGSPFPEDAKLCAALSTFWPAVAPDATRGLQPALTARTVSPLTDEEVGSVGQLPWDGVPGPKLVLESGLEFAVYPSFNHADYTLNALRNRMTLSLTGHISTAEYQHRVLAMALVYRALGRELPQGSGGNPREGWLVLSFRHAAPGDAERQAAQQEAALTLTGAVFRFELIRNTRGEVRPDKTWRIRVLDRTRLFAAPEIRRVLILKPGTTWKVANLGTV